MNFELESDMKAAKMLGYRPHIMQVRGVGVVFIAYPPVSLNPNDGDKACDVEERVFTLSDPATRDAVVTVLWERYGVCIFHTHPDFPAQGWVAENAINGWESDIYESRTECIRHAVMEVKDE